MGQEIKPAYLYTTNDEQYTVLVTSVVDNPVIEDLQVEYYVLQPQCFSSKKYFLKNFKELKDDGT